MMKTVVLVVVAATVAGALVYGVVINQRPHTGIKECDEYLAAVKERGDKHELHNRTQEITNMINHYTDTSGRQAVSEMCQRLHKNLPPRE